MNKTRILFFMVLCSVASIYASSWNVLVYMDSSDGLSDMAIKNITDMVRAQPDDTIDFFVQLHAYDNAALRYRITKTGLVFVEQATLTGDSKRDLLDAATWGFVYHHADHTMLIFWNHGWGILDPHWNGVTNEWEIGQTGLSNGCPVNRSHFSKYNLCKMRRGFMFSESPRTYLTNENMIEALSFVKETLLEGKKIDVLAFDTCMGGMLEVAYQVAPYAKHLLGNQSCSLRDGFDYQGIVTALNKKPNPRELAKDMVHAFDDYYLKHDASGVYTHTALDLSYADLVCKKLDSIVVKLFDTPEFLPFILKAHDASPRFCLFPMYSDLVSFMKYIEKQLDETAHVSVDTLKQAIQEFYHAIDLFVVARCGGHTTQGNAHGFAVYLPSYTIDDSYKQTLFAQKSSWIRLLEYIEQNSD